jgi:hypothetical protein
VVWHGGIVESLNKSTEQTTAEPPHELQKMFGLSCGWILSR